MRQVRWWRHNWLIFDVVNRWLESRANSISGVVYDLGCGERPYQAWLEERIETYVGVDWEHSLHSTEPDIQADLNEPLPVDEGVADTVLSVSVLEHLHRPYPFVQEIYRILKPGGHVLLQVPFQWRVHEAPYDYFRYTSFGLTRMFEEAGFERITVEAHTGFWTTWVLKFNYHTYRWCGGSRFPSRFLRLLIAPVWMLDQLLAEWLDRIDPSPEETASYGVIARKPGRDRVDG